MRVALTWAVAGTLFLFLAGIAEAQEQIRVSVNGGTQVGSHTVSQAFSLPLYQEDADIFNDIDVSGGGVFDIGVAYRVAGPLWAGVSFSSVSRNVESELVAELPHPFFFNRPREVSGAISDLDSKERAIHISAAYLLPLSDKVDVAVFGGPSRLSTTQDLVTDVDYSETYPYDTATLISATTTSASGSAWGLNVGADVTWRLSRIFAAGGLLRFTKASTTLVADPGNEADVDAGGLMVGVGLRMIF